VHVLKSVFVLQSIVVDLSNMTIANVCMKVKSKIKLSLETFGLFSEFESSVFTMFSLFLGKLAD
jgi:hypothetical protein